MLNICRSIRLDEHSFPAATDDDSESLASNSTPRRLNSSRQHFYPNLVSRPVSSDTTTHDVSESHFRPESNSLVLDHLGHRDNLTTSEEILLLRRQMAKLNHR